MNNPCEFTAVWNPETHGWDIFLDQELCYFTLSHQDLTEFARDHLASNSPPD